MRHPLLKTLLLVFMSGFIATDSCAQLAAGQRKFLGNIFGGLRNGGMVEDPTFQQYWNQATPENAGKHGLYETSRDTYQRQSLDQIYNYCVSNNIPFKQHTFLFWCCGADADWLEGLTASQIREEMEEWMIDFFKRYPKTAYAEVVNEPFQSPPPAKIRNALGGDTNFEWVRWMYRKARQHAPSSCQLWINENNVLKGGGRVDRYRSLISKLKEDGNIDVIGVQGHWLENVSANTLRQTLNQLATLDLPISITEYDVNEGDMNKQRDIWAAQFPVFWEHPAVIGVTLWGYKEGRIWRPQAYLVRADGSERPAVQWLRNYLKGADDSDGEMTVRARGITGSERIEIRVEGQAVKSWTLKTGYANYTVRGVNTSGNIKVAFVNDNTQRDVRVDYLRVNGVTRQAESQAVNTSAWSNGSCGGSYSEWMYCNGHIDFGTFQSNARSSTIVSEKDSQTGSFNAPLLIVYPNPARQNFTIEVSDPAAELTLVNQLGQVVRKIPNTGEAITVNVADVSPGIYFLSSASASSVFQQKLLIE